MMMFKKKAAPAAPKNTMPPLEPEEDEVPDRGGSGAKWITALCILVAIALVVASLPSGISAVTTVNSKVLSATSEENTISTVLSGGGTLSAQEGTTLTVPQALEIQSYYVKNGDRVSAGDPIAQVDKVAVISALSELQTVLEKLDAAIASAANSSNPTTLSVGTAGRVKKIYAQEGTPVSDTVYENGALMLLSLDGLMSLTLEGDFQVGQSVTVTCSDGTALEGTVDAISDGTATVTCSDEAAPFGDTVTVTDSTGKVLGQGTLSIHSMLRVTGAYGTVSRVNVRENQKVSAGSTLLTLKDTGRTAQYANLLNRRAELEDQLASLVALSKDGILYADTDGIVSGVDTSIDYTAPEAPQRSHASPGYHVVAEIRMDAVAGTGSGDATDDNADTGNGSNTGGGEDNENGGNTGGDDSGGNNTPGGEETPDPPAQQEYTLGLVLTNQDGTLLYLPQGTLKLAENSALPSLSLSGEPNGGASVSTGDYAVKTVTAEGWTDADAGQITQGDTIIFGNGILVFQHNAGSGGGMQLPDGFDISSMLGSMGSMSGMSGMSGAYSGTTATPVYDSYDTTQKDVVTLTPDEEMTVELNVDELDILTLQVGMEAQVTLDALPGQAFTGTITKINTYGTNSGGNTKYTVTVTLPRSDKMLSGMNASVKITTAVSQPVQTVPAEAILFDSGKSWLYTGYDEKTDTLTDPVEIQTGLSDGKLVELLSGLEPGTPFYYRYADSIEYSFVK